MVRKVVAFAGAVIILAAGARINPLGDPRATKALASQTLARGPLNLGISFDKSYYTSNDTFNTKIFLFNKSSESVKKAKISLIIRRKIGAKLKIIFRKTWWKTLPSGATTLELEKRIAAFGRRDGVFPVTVTVDRFRVVHLEKKSSLLV